jgi:hypothetical protein
MDDTGNRSEHLCPPPKLNFFHSISILCKTAPKKELWGSPSSILVNYSGWFKSQPLSIHPSNTPLKQKGESFLCPFYATKKESFPFYKEKIIFNWV